MLHSFKVYELVMITSGKDVLVAHPQLHAGLTGPMTLMPSVYQGVLIEVECSSATPVKYTHV